MWMHYPNQGAPNLSKVNRSQEEHMTWTRRCVTGVLALALLVPTGTLLPAAIGMVSVAVSAQENVTSFEFVSEHGRKTTALFNGITAKIHVATLGIDPLNKSRKVMLYGQLDLPATAVDIGLEEFDGASYLPEGDNGIKYNGFISKPLIWSPQDPASNKYDRRIFSIDEPIWVKHNEKTITLKVAGVEEAIEVPTDSAVLDTSALEGALTEHWNTYQAALSAGMLIEATSEQAYVAADASARTLVEKARAGGDAAPSNEELEAARIALNEVFAQVTPRPFDRAPLKAALKRARAILDTNGKDAKRLNAASFSELTKAIARASDLVAVEDPHSLLVSAHGEPLPTHRDFSVALAALEGVIDGATWEPYRAVDRTDLVKAYDEAIERRPSTGKGFTAASREKLFASIDRAQRLIEDSVYATPAQVAAQMTELKAACAALEEIALDPAETISFTVRYQHPAEGTVTALIHENFVGEDGNPVEESFAAVQGQEIRMDINDPLFKRFEGYGLRSFHLNGDDGTLRLVRILTNSRGEQTVAFVAAGSPLRVRAAGEAVARRSASLELRYARGSEYRQEKPATDGGSVAEDVPTYPGSTGPEVDADKRGGEPMTRPVTPIASATRTGALASTGAAVSTLCVVACIALSAGIILTAGRVRRKRL